MQRIGLSAALLLVALWAAAQVPAVLVGLPRPAPDQTPPSVATALERCVQSMGAASSGSFTAGPGMVRGRKVVLVARSESVALVCTVNGNGTDITTVRREIHHDMVVDSLGITGDPPNGNWFTYGVVRADVPRLTIRTASGQAVPAQVSSGSFLADLTGVREDGSPYLLVHQALDARGAVLYEGW